MQNENSQRAFTSEKYYADVRRPDRRTPMKVLTDKTFTFVDTIWETYMEHNMVDVRYIYMCMHVHMYIYLYVLHVHFAGLYLGKVMGVTVMKTI